MEPFIKYAGGKRQLLPQINERLPKTYGDYYEPFLGGGAVFMDLKPKKAYLNDFNESLINAYKQIKNNVDELKSVLDQFQEHFNSLPGDDEKKAYYYEMRDLYNRDMREKEFSIMTAALLIFLNKAGFNGLYRCNSKGEFNVPFGQKKRINLYSSDNLDSIANGLSNATITVGDFEKACEGAKAGDFVFFDSPYYDTFDTYQGGGFSEADHRRLASLYKELTDKGVYCMLTNSNTDFIKELYKDYRVDVVSVKRMINRNANDRTGEEVIVINYVV